MDGSEKADFWKDSGSKWWDLEAAGTSGDEGQRKADDRGKETEGHMF